MSEIKHSPLPFHACQYEIGTIYSAKRLLVAKNVIFGRTIGLNDVDFIVEACNNYYKLKEQNEKLKEALSSIKIHIDFCGDESWAESLQSSREYKQMVEALKSCES